MEALTIEHANAMPAPTWHRLHMNEATIELPQDLVAAQQVHVICDAALLGNAGAFEDALQSLAANSIEDSSASTSTLTDPLVNSQERPDADIDALSLSAYQQEALEARYLSPAEIFTTGMGDEAREYLEFVAGEPLVFATQPGEVARAAVHINGVDGAANAAALDIVAAAGSSLSLSITLNSPTVGSGVVGTRLRVFAGVDAQVNVIVTQTLDDSWITLDDTGIVADERARVQVRHTVLGAGHAYTGLDANLQGDDARLDLDTRYLGHAHELRDFNYVVHQRGRRSVCNLNANGVLAGESEKTLRGTIELVHGCKGSKGSEQETVLLADERVINRTVPVILCDEDDVAGNHGATIGHVRPEQLFYLASRGISPDEAERLFITALFEEAALNAPDEYTRAAVARLAATRAVKLPVPTIAANPYRNDFPLLAANPDLAFLDSAATAQRPTVALDAQRTFYETMNANALRGLYSLSVEATAAIEAARSHIAHFIGAADAREVVFTRNASESLNLVARAFAPTVLKPGDEVCITIMEHHSNLIPWQQACRDAGAHLVYLFPNEEGVITDEELDAKIGPRTKIVAAAQVSNVLGIENPIAAMAQRVHAHGGYLVVDGAQSVPHMAVDMQKLHCDFFAFSAHKALGPFGIGVLWGSLDLLEAMPPFLTGGEMISSVTQDDAVWAPVPEKFEAGTQDAAGIVATSAALGYLENIGWDALETRERALVRAAMERMSALPYIQIIGHSDPDKHHGVISFNVDGIHPHDVASILDDQHVAIRAGHHCAQPLLAWLGVESCCRASLAFYNDESDIDALIAGLDTAWRTFNG